MLSTDPIHIRDPIHGSIALTPNELKLIDHKAFQRLRNIKQLGFADLSFPGATHTRYSHSLGAMHIATRIFDILFRPGDLPDSVRTHFRQSVRLAVLFHDIGHAPLSHTTEMLMPNFGDKQATHEDYTLKIIMDSPLTKAIGERFGGEVVPQQIGSLIDERIKTNAFCHQNHDYAPVLRQIVSSECDADRMDYLQRDSFYCGVNYGKFDADWLIDNMTPIERDGQIFLGLKSRAIFSFEDFLLSRYHMFASVYLHHTPVIFEKMLELAFSNPNERFAIPADIEQYIGLDDIDIWAFLRKCKNPWALRIVERSPYRLLDERLNGPHDQLLAALTEAGIDTIRTESKSVLSKYFGHGRIPIFVQTNAGQIVSLESYTPLYDRYSSPAQLSRLYVHPAQRPEALKIFSRFTDHA